MKPGNQACHPMPFNEVLISSFVEKTLREAKGSLTEWRLLKAIRDEGLAWYDELLTDNLDLFRAHFGLFHILYKMRDDLLDRQEGHLVIHPLQVELLDYSPAPESIDNHDPLRDYYLDESNLGETSLGDVDSMLESLWQRLDRDVHRVDALTALGLEDPVDDATIQRRYRELAREHHPDRGGSKERFQAINAAMDRLRS